MDEMPSARDGWTFCRFCATPLELTVVDLGMSPLCESFLPAAFGRQLVLQATQISSLGQRRAHSIEARS